MHSKFNHILVVHLFKCANMPWHLSFYSHFWTFHVCSESLRGWVKYVSMIACKWTLSWGIWHAPKIIPRLALIVSLLDPMLKFWHGFSIEDKKICVGHNRKMVTNTLMLEHQEQCDTWISNNKVSAQQSGVTVISGLIRIGWPSRPVQVTRE
jgi:hypothetical protein